MCWDAGPAPAGAASRGEQIATTLAHAAAQTSVRRPHSPNASARPPPDAGLRTPVSGACSVGPRPSPPPSVPPCPGQSVAPARALPKPREVRPRGWAGSARSECGPSRRLSIWGPPGLGRLLARTAEAENRTDLGSQRRPSLPPVVFRPRRWFLARTSGLLQEQLHQSACAGRGRRVVRTGSVRRGIER